MQQGQFEENMAFVAFNVLIGFVLVIKAVPCAGLYRCAEGWNLHGDLCYHFNLTWSARVTWHQARHLCEAMGAQMLRITNQDEQDYIQRKTRLLNSTQDQMWLGLYDSGQKNNAFVWTSNNQGITFQNWAENEPSNQAEDCVYITTRVKWADASCDSKLPYICEKSYTDDSDDACPLGWQKYLQTCYLIPTNITEVLTWEAARTKCQQLQADLVTIEYPEENNFLSAFLPTSVSQNYWIGLNDRKSEGRWRWNDESGSAQWYNWYVSQPDNGNSGPKNCVALMGKSRSWKGKWSPRYCEQTSLFLCKANATVRDSQLTCGQDWIRNGEYCYFLGKNYTSWTLARTTCQYKGGDLASITSNAETKFITDNILNVVTNVWIGLHNNNGTNKWYWLNETTKPTVYTSWLPWEPWESKLFTCVMMHATSHNLGKWDNVQCDTKFPFICQGFDKSVECKSPWKAFAGECYLVRRSTVNWYQARQICQRLRSDADLAEVNSLSVQYFLNGLIANNEGYGGFWFGLNALKQWETYQWINQSKSVAFTNWDIRQPDHIRDDGCVAMYTHLIISNVGQWNDAHCFQRAGLGCQTNAVNTFYDFQMEGVMYKFVGELLAYPEAKEYCTLTLGDGAELANVESMELWHALISNAKLHRTASPKQLWVGAVDEDLFPVDDSAFRNSEKSDSHHDIKDWCTYITENASKTQWTQEYSLVKDSCYTRKYSVCQKPSSILGGLSFRFIFNNLTYLIVRDLTQIRPDLNRTCQMVMGDDEARVASLENDDQVMALFTEIRAIQNGDDDNTGYWVDTNAQPDTLLKKTLKGLPMSIKCPLMRLEKLSSDWSIHTAVQSVQAADCLEYHQAICQRTILEKEKGDEEVYFANAVNSSESESTKQPKINESNFTSQPKVDEIKITPGDQTKYSCTGTCVGLAVVLTIIIIISLCLLAALLYIKRRWICSLCETAPDVVRLRDRSEPTSYTDPPPLPEEDATPT